MKVERDRLVRRGVEGRRGKTARLDIRHQPSQHDSQKLVAGLVQLAGAQPFVEAGTQHNLLAELGRKALDRGQQGFVDRFVGQGRGAPGQLKAGKGEQVRRRRLLLVGRQLVDPGRHDLAYTADRFIDVDDSVVDAPVLVEQDDVAVPAHDLGDQTLADRIAQLVNHCEMEDEDPLIARRLDGCQAGAEQVLAQQHAKHRWRPRVFPVLVGHMQARRRRVGGDEQAMVSAVAAQDEQDVGAVRLVDAIDAGTGQELVELRGKAAG